MCERFKKVEHNVKDAGMKKVSVKKIYPGLFFFFFRLFLIFTRAFILKQEKEKKKMLVRLFFHNLRYVGIRVSLYMQKRITFRYTYAYVHMYTSTYLDFRNTNVASRRVASYKIQGIGKLHSTHTYYIIQCMYCTRMYLQTV